MKRQQRRRTSRLYWLLAFLLLGGALYAGSRAPAQEKQEEVRDEDFIPTEDVPPGAAISFPVDI